MEITTNGTGYRNVDWCIADELDSDSELRIELSGGASGQYASAYVTKDEAIQLANALLLGAGVSGTVQVLKAPDLNEARVRDIVREVLRDTFNN